LKVSGLSSPQANQGPQGVTLQKPEKKLRRLTPEEKAARRARKAAKAAQQ